MAREPVADGRPVWGSAVGRRPERVTECAILPGGSVQSQIGAYNGAGTGAWCGAARASGRSRRPAAELPRLVARASRGCATRRASGRSAGSGIEAPGPVAPAARCRVEAPVGSRLECRRTHELTLRCS